jgi:hypothetical protein
LSSHALGRKGERECARVRSVIAMKDFLLACVEELLKQVVNYYEGESGIVELVLFDGVLNLILAG